MREFLLVCKKSGNFDPSQVMLMAFWNCRSLVYPEFGPDGHKERQNGFDALMHWRNVIQPMRRGLPSQKVILIRDNAHLHRVRLIQTLLKGSCWEQFEYPPYSPDLVLSNHHLFSWIEKELGRVHILRRHPMRHSCRCGCVRIQHKCGAIVSPSKHIHTNTNAFPDTMPRVHVNVTLKG